MSQAMVLEELCQSCQKHNVIGNDVRGNDVRGNDVRCNDVKGMMKEVISKE